MYESGHYKLYLSPEDDATARLLLSAGEDVYPVLVRVYGGAPANKTSVYVFPTVEAARELVSLPPTVQPGSSGGSFDAFPPLGDGIKGYNILGGDGQVNDMRVEGVKSFFAHEGGHRFFYYMYPRLRKPVRPNWLDEGMAMYAGEQATDGFREYGFGVAREKIISDGPTSLKELDRLQESAETLELFYGESSAVINYLVGRYGEDGLRSLLAEYNRTRDLNGAFKKTFGVSEKDFELQYSNRTKEMASRAADGNEFYRLLKAG